MRSGTENTGKVPEKSCCQFRNHRGPALGYFRDHIESRRVYPGHSIRVDIRVLGSPGYRIRSRRSDQHPGFAQSSDNRIYLEIGLDCSPDIFSFDGSGIELGNLGPPELVRCFNRVWFGFGSGLPAVLVMLALITDLIYRRPIDWWAAASGS